MQRRPLIISPAGGVVKTLADVEKYAKAAVNRILVGSITWDFRIGNEAVAPGELYYFDPETGESGNAFGLNNNGAERYARELGTMVRIAHSQGKELWVSIVGESVDEIIKLVRFCFEHRVDGVQINLACPNVHDQGVQKPLFCNDPALVEQILWRLETANCKGRPIGIKLAPTEDETLLRDLCKVVRVTNVVTEVVAANTEGNVRFLRNGVDRIAFRPPGSSEVKYTGGRGGRPNHQLVVRMADRLVRLLPNKVRVIGVTGIFEAETALDFINVGASGFECGTACQQFGPRIFRDIVQELPEHILVDAA